MLVKQKHHGAESPPTNLSPKSRQKTRQFTFRSTKFSKPENVFWKSMCDSFRLGSQNDKTKRNKFQRLRPSGVSDTQGTTELQKLINYNLTNTDLNVFTNNSLRQQIPPGAEDPSYHQHTNDSQHNNTESNSYNHTSNFAQRSKSNNIFSSNDLRKGNESAISNNIVQSIMSRTGQLRYPKNSELVSEQGKRKTRYQSPKDGQSPKLEMAD